MQALMLAAGMGKRLGKLTRNNTKCMLPIQGKTLIERAVEALLDAGVNKMTIVVGYKGDNLKKFLTEECTNPRIKEMEFVFIDNPVYDKTNNIYSLYLGREVLKEDDTILLESDLIYEPELIKQLVESDKKNAVTVAKYDQWMDGTVIKIGENDQITEFIEKKDFNYDDVDKYYKTVNIYKFSKEFSEKQILPFLSAYIEAYGENEYYELIFKIIAHLSRSDLKALDIGKIKWYEMDDIQDVQIANVLFAEGEEKLKLFQKMYGGYWRFKDVLDYCYLVNPYYPPKEMFDKFEYESRELITQYPSGLEIQNINLSRLFNNAVDDKYLIAGNGAAELINVLGKILDGDMLVPKTAFNEYIRCFNKSNFEFYDESKTNFQFDINKIMEASRYVDIVCIINPDNPTGAYMEYEDLINIIQECQRNNKWIIVDESFIDFADKDKRYTLIKDEILERYPRLIVIKSISKSYGVPGIRLGALATSNNYILSKVKEKLAVWNIGSFGEFFLQNCTLYNKAYISACDKIAEERHRFTTELRNLGIEVYESQANFVLVNLDSVNSTELAVDLLCNYDIFIKDLRTKKSFKDQNFVRLAIRTTEENNKLIEGLKKALNKEDKTRKR